MSSDGESFNCTIEFVLLVDVRGYSGFCQQADIERMEQFVQKTFSIFDAIFTPCLKYKKCTGDGLLGVLGSEQQLPEAIEYLVLSSIFLIESFPSLVSDIKDAPTDLGIVITQGYLLEGEVFGIKDFFGPAINIAAKICTKVRPSGLFIHESLSKQLLPNKLSAQLTEIKMGVESNTIEWEENGSLYVPIKYRPKDHGIPPLLFNPYNLGKLDISINLDGTNLDQIPNLFIEEDKISDTTRDWFSLQIWLETNNNKLLPIIIPWRTSRQFVEPTSEYGCSGKINLDKLVQHCMQHQNGVIKEINLLS